VAVRDLYQRIERPIAGAGLRLIRPWERLSVPLQIGIAFPVLAFLLFLLHLGPLNQPLARAAFYGVFWSVIATPVLVLATQNELRKRERNDQPPAERTD
jgi:Kef-type K+ transport system membrane component KefB